MIYLIYSAFNVFAVLMFIYVWGMVRKVDVYARYNDEKEDFKAPAKWMKILFRLRSQRIPKYIYYKCISIVAILSGPIGAVVYYWSGHNRIVAMVYACVQAAYCVIDLLIFNAFFNNYNARRKSGE